MTFTYAISNTPTDLTKVRYYTGDTDSTAAIWQDDEINMVLALEGSVGGAVVSLIKSIMRKLANEPDMKADWLSVDWRSSREQWAILLAKAERDFGLGWQDASSSQHSYRPDTLQKEPPDYDEEDS